MRETHTSALLAFLDVRIRSQRLGIELAYPFFKMYIERYTLSIPTTLDLRSQSTGIVTPACRPTHHREPPYPS